jgi:hypothetical protein
MNKRHALKYLIFVPFSLVFAASGVFAQSGDSLVISYSYINSLPQNAEVFINDEYAGKTPFRFTRSMIDTSKPLLIKIKLEGYMDFVMKIDPSALPLNKTIALVSRSLSTIKEEIVIESKSSYFKTPRRIVPIILSGLVTAGSASLSYYFKSLANDTYDEYLQTGDKIQLDKTKRYDLYSAIGLVAFQAGLAGLIYFLLIE